MEIEKLFVSLFLNAAQYVRGLADSRRAGAGWATQMRRIIGGGLQKAAQIGGAALLGLVATIGTVALLGINQFIGFQNQMNEVFTLLPGISQTAMDDMSDQVLAFSKEFAVLPEGVVPALYQSLSAGVPPDNVFSFLETAQMAAVGGITELETAVDGISSVVNAYGSDVLEAAEASDIMFTAVRLGKTDFQQLSDSLFNVIPTAASLGVSFEEVAAGLATLTAQGTPTSVATTQLRQLFVEASKSGSELDTTIRNLAGTGIADLIAEGSTVTEVLQDVRDAVGEEQFRNMFSSVEALNAALGTTGPNIESMTDNITSMNDAAGATQAAYDQMNTGISRSIERFKAFKDTALIQVGDALSPIIEKVLSLGEQALPFIETALDNVTSFLDGFFVNLESGQDILGAAVDAFLTWTAVGENAPVNFVDFLLNLESGARGLWTQLQALITQIVQLWTQLQPIIAVVVAVITQFVSWKDVLLAVGVVLVNVLLNSLPAIMAALAPTIVAIQAAIATFAPIIAAVAALIAVFALLRHAWETDLGGIRTAVTDFWEGTVQPILDDIREWLAVNLPIALAFLRAFWVEQAWPAIQQALQVAWGIIQIIFQAVVNYITNTLVPTVQALWDYWVNTAWPAIQTALSAAWEFMQPILTSLKDFILNTVIPTVEDLYTKWTTIWWPTIQTVLENVWTIIEAVWTELGRWINDNIVPWLEFLHDKWVEEVWPAIQTALENVWAAILPIWETVKAWLETTIPTALDGLKEAWDRIWNALGPVVQPVKQAIDDIKSAVESFWNFLSSHTFSFNINLPDLPEWAIPGSPLPIHTAWHNFAAEMNQTRIAPRVDLAGVTPLLGTAVNHSAATHDNRRYETTVQLPAGADPLRALRAARHLDKLGRQ